MRIALVGSAPSSIHLAPYDDPSWQIWGCSPAASVAIKRADVWFELHRWNQDWLSVRYREWLQKFAGTIYTIEPVPELPTSVAYPKDEMLKEFGPYFFTSSLSWMLAMAITLNPTEIGLWGVDMAAHEEYGQQRPGCHYFRQIAIDRGIKFTVPLESDLEKPPALYGFSETSPMLVKLLARQKELENRLATTQANMENSMKESLFLQGALDDLKYIINTWA